MNLREFIKQIKNRNGRMVDTSSLVYLGIIQATNYPILVQFFNLIMLRVENYKPKERRAFSKLGEVILYIRLDNVKTIIKIIIHNE